MARPPAVALALCLLAVVAGASAGVGATAAGADAFQVGGESFDRVQFRLAVQTDGAARWTFHYERTLANESEREQFEAYAASFTANETPLYTDFRNQSRTLVRRGQNATGREMAATAFERRAFVTTQLDNDVGVVEMAFTWRGFAPVDGDRVVVGDVFEGGLYLGPDQSLVVRAGEGLAFRSVEPAAITSADTLAASDTVTWQGERAFADNHPRVELGPANGTPGPTVDAGPTTAVGGTATAADPAESPVWPVGLVLAVIGAALLAFFYRRRAAPPAEGSASGSGSTQSTPAVDEAALLNDEERVASLLRERGGRMRQSAIVEASGWSKSKVSMVLSEMAEDGAIRKLRVGRENIISLPGHEPDAARSSLEDPEENRGPES